MCTRYISLETADIERHWDVGRGGAWRGLEMFPRSPGPFIRAARDATEPERELVIGQWGPIPWFANTATLTYSTVNARFEKIKTKASFKDPWRYAKRCIMLAVSFDEPCWETWRNVWWRFLRADGAPLGLAGLWNAWTDKATGEVIESHTTLTINADAHPLKARMHKPDPKLPADQQDTRSVVTIEFEDVDT